MDDNSLAARLLKKSEEAFLMAIEVYNKPSIRYRAVKAKYTGNRKK